MYAVNMVSNLLTGIWSIVCLGAFRQIHGVSRKRSALACLLIRVTWWPYAAVQFFLAIGMFGQEAPPLT